MVGKMFNQKYITYLGMNRAGIGTFKSTKPTTIWYVYNIMIIIIALIFLHIYLLYMLHFCVYKCFAVASAQTGLKVHTKHTTNDDSPVYNFFEMQIFYLYLLLKIYKCIPEAVHPRSFELLHIWFDRQHWL